MNIMFGSFFIALFDLPLWKCKSISDTLFDRRRWMNLVIEASNGSTKLYLSMFLTTRIALQLQLSWRKQRCLWNNILHVQKQWILQFESSYLTIHLFIHHCRNMNEYFTFVRELRDSAGSTLMFPPTVEEKTHLRCFFIASTWYYSSCNVCVS